MFIDLVGSTTLSQQLDPEDYHARVVAYQAACRQVIARYEGHIAQYLGDGVLVYFGYPTAHEEDAVRAVRSGLEIVAAVSQLAYTPPLQVRIGIHTGPVVVGEIGAGERTERLALGETPNIAARVQGQAEPNTVVMSAATYRLVQGLFECQDLGPQELKGISTPLTLYRVIGESAAQSRFEVAVANWLDAVGRPRGRTRTCCSGAGTQAKAGAGQVVLLSGEPGLANPAWCRNSKSSLRTKGRHALSFAARPITRTVRCIRSSTTCSACSSLRARMRLPSSWRNSSTRSATIASLRPTQCLCWPPCCRFPHPEGYPPITVSPQKQKEKTQAALVAWLVEEAEKAAVYCAWEDLHWADPSTLEVLTLFLDQVPTTRLLALLTFRPEFIPPWGNRSHLSQMTLSRLGRPRSRPWSRQVTGGKALPSEVVQQIVTKTDGVPLFVEELTKTVVESVESSDVRGHGACRRPYAGNSCNATGCADGAA